MNVEYTKAELLYELELHKARLTRLRSELAEATQASTTFPAERAGEMRRLVTITAKLEAALHPPSAKLVEKFVETVLDEIEAMTDGAGLVDFVHLTVAELMLEGGHAFYQTKNADLPVKVTVVTADSVPVAAGLSKLNVTVETDFDGRDELRWLQITALSEG
jgi:hypothetical protein